MKSFSRYLFNKAVWLEPQKYVRDNPPPCKELAHRKKKISSNNIEHPPKFMEVVLEMRREISSWEF